MDMGTRDSMPQEDPIKKIEDKQAWIDFGKMAYYAWTGAVEEGATTEEAFWCIIAYFAGMNIGASNQNPPEEENDEGS